MGTENSAESRSSAHPTFPGNAFMNAGFLFVLPALLWGALIGLADRLASRHAELEIWWGGIAFIALAYLLRGSVYHAALTLILSLLSAAAVVLAARWRRAARPEPAAAND